MSKKRWLTLRVLCIFVFLIGTFGWSSKSLAASTAPLGSIDEWRMKWGGAAGDNDQLIPSASDPGWMTIRAGEAKLDRPASETTAWVQLKLPELNGQVSLLKIKKLFALNVKVYKEQQLVFESNRNYLYDKNNISLPLYPEDSGKTLSIWMETTPAFKMLGLFDKAVVYPYTETPDKSFTLLHENELMSGGLFFAALAILICGMLQGAYYRTIWLSLGIIIVCTGGIILSESLLSVFNSANGSLLIFIYDLSMAIGLLMLTVFFEKIFGPGRFHLIRRFRIFQTFYSALCILLSFLTAFVGLRFALVSALFTSTWLGYIMMVQFILLLSSAIIYATRGHKEAIIFTLGFSIFAVVGLLELVWYYFDQGHYEIHLWKWGLFAFIIALMVIVGRTVALNYRQLVKYSKQLEMFNNELQRSEKMDIISELAASVAHEVRNPLQVTRGFLQLLDGKYSSPTDTTYVKLALNELDRASGIITDFLTFAKPGIEDVVTLNLAHEFEQVENILQPLAHLQGGRLNIAIPADLFTKGNPPKFKQAIVNIVKNSIEAFREEGHVDITAYTSGDDVVLSIKDNGEGMEGSEIARLGEPYFSNKTKGTGLGLMVTFRIIEAMKGTLQFKSQKGKGTEVLIRVPRAANPTTAP
ncbi:sensor histidine kinase [Gorillibacterium timonense]|uniref:sensor histidine kinase n=1 Tax=Gorillibacterium timonense TaxID=1689269 RepID=UPI00071D4DBC|nr:sensor histidine kinase [Gorillibacterium timonense]